MNKRKFSQIFLISILSVLFAATMMPFYLTIVNSVKHNLQIVENIWVISFPMHFDNYSMAFKEIWRGMLNSVWITLCITGGAVSLSALAGYSFGRFNFPGKTVMFFMIIMFLMIPGFVTLVPQFMLVKNMGLLNSFSGQILPVIAGQAVMPVMLFRTQFESIPKSLFEAAEIEGAGEFTIFARIAVPLSKAMFGTTAIITGLHAWNNYIWPLIIVRDKRVTPVVLMLQNISNNAKEGMGPLLAGYVIASVPLILLFTFATKPFVKGITAGAIKA